MQCRLSTLALLLSLLGGCALSPGSPPGLPEGLDTSALHRADIAILGEVHDNGEHHRNQAALIRELSPAAVVFEMLSPEQATRANAMAERDAALRAALDWDAGGWPAWTLYEPVFAAVGKLPIYGMALPRETVKRAVTEGAADPFGDDAATYGLAEPLPAAEQQAREEHQQSVHCNQLPTSLLPGMVEAQRLRDASFARSTLRALRDTGGPVVVVTGSGHARRDWGMPGVLKRVAPDATVVSLGQLEAAPESPPPYDLWIVTDPAPRSDPCAGFSMSRSR